jgi:hypothetical protein
MDAIVLDAAAFHERDDAIDVFAASGDPACDQAARSMDAQLLVIDDGGGLEVPRERVCCIGIGGVMSLGCRQNMRRRGIEHSFVRPSNGGRLRSPNLARIFNGLAEAPGVAGLVQELLFPVKAQIVPVEIVFASILFRVADDLSVAFAEEGDSRSRWF